MLLAIAFADMPYRVALPGYEYSFPRDHFNHPEFQTEWWYYTGNLTSREGRRFGFELTFFRHAVDRTERANVWDVRDVWLAHFAVSDIESKRFVHTERINRTGAGLAGADAGRARVWNGNWFVQSKLDRSAPGGVDRQQLEAIAEGFAVSLELRPLKPPVIHGRNGLSQKSEGAGRASHYVSYTRLATRGTLTLESQQFAVEGISWMDHEFFTHQLEQNQTGWDWFSLQFEDGSELMLFRLRRKDGSVDPHSAGTWVDARGRARQLTSAAFELRPTRTWTSPETRGTYPVEWSIRIPPLDLEVELRPLLDGQELVSTTGSRTVYWEGAIDVAGTRQGRPIRATGYLEMTGYAGPVRMGE
jgi:predicted secreted hydrolase